LFIFIIRELRNLNVDEHTTYEHHNSIQSFQQSLANVVEENLVDRVRRERKGLYVQSTQIGYIRTSKAWKKEK